jgi:hypothetical protein
MRARWSAATTTKGTHAKSVPERSAHSPVGPDKQGPSRNPEQQKHVLAMLVGAHPDPRDFVREGRTRRSGSLGATFLNEGSRPS